MARERRDTHRDKSALARWQRPDDGQELFGARAIDSCQKRPAVWGHLQGSLTTVGDLLVTANQAAAREGRDEPRRR